ncbi:MAG TPA: ABC transporter transmembrane domain-containing protein, partial [Atopostipes sp.]|nr:ABC transporter transmembrane domain-containing protein [Atopostipes sp.]
MMTYIKRFWKDNLTVGILLFGIAVSQTSASILNAKALNALISLDFEGFLIASLQMFTVYMFFLLFTYLRVVKQNSTIQKMLTSIRTDITGRIERTSYQGFHEKQVGTYASWLSNDMNTLESQAFEGLYQISAGIIASITSVVALFFFHWSLVLWSMIAAGLTILLPRVLQKQMGQAALATTEENERFLSKANDVLGGFDTLFSYSMLKKITSDIKEASLSLAAAKDKQARVFGKVAILGALGNVFGQLSVLVLTGYLAFQGLLSIGSIASTGGLAGTIFNTVGNISQQLSSVRSTEPIFEKFETIASESSMDKEDLQTLKDGFKV